MSVYIFCLKMVGCALRNMKKYEIIQHSRRNESQSLQRPEQSVRSRRNGEFINLKHLYSRNALSNFRLMIEQEENVFLIILLMMLFKLFLVTLLSAYLWFNNKDQEDSPEGLLQFI